jgi:hypothetical protein
VMLGTRLRSIHLLRPGAYLCLKQLTHPTLLAEHGKVSYIESEIIIICYHEAGELCIRVRVAVICSLVFNLMTEGVD